MLRVHISPQFYVKHDPLIDVVQQQILQVQLEKQAGFVTKREQQIDNNDNVTILKQVL